MSLVYKTLYDILVIRRSWWGVWWCDEWRSEKSVLVTIFHFIFIFIYIFFQIDSILNIHINTSFTIIITDYDDVGEESNKEEGSVWLNNHRHCLGSRNLKNWKINWKIWKLNSLSNISMWNLSLNVIWNLFCNLTFLITFIEF